MAEEKSPASASRGRRWHHESANSRPAPGVQRRRRLFYLALVLMALLGSFLAWLFLWKPYDEPAFATMAITQYSDPRWPENALAEQDGSALYDLFHQEHVKKKEDLFTTQLRSLLVGQLEDLQKHQTVGQPVVIHLCALARTDADGDVFVLPADAVPEDNKTWVSLRDVLRWVNHCPARHKLLILDLMRPIAEPRLGILVNNVAERVEATLREEPDLPYFVLCACSPGQVSLVAEELGQSVFGYYLFEGLRGGTAGAEAKEHGHHWVRVTDLAAYVAAHVDHWARQRGQRQTPYLWRGQAKDFSLLSSGRATSAEEADQAAYPPALAAGWKQWEDQHQAARSGEAAAWVLRRLEGKLLNAEYRWRSGRRQAWGELPAETARLANQARQAQEVSRPRFQRSLALEAAQRGVTPRNDLVEVLKKLWEDWTRLPEPAPPAPAAAKSKKPVIDPKIADFEKKLDKELRKQDSFELALAIWELASADDTEPRPDRRALVLYDWYRKFKRPTARRFVETMFLERLSELKPEEAGISGAAVRQALQLVREGEQVFGSPRAFVWVRPLLTQAQVRRTEAEKLLFSPMAETRAGAEAAIADALRQFRRVQGYLPAIEEAYQCRDDALAFLPAYAVCLLNRLDFDLNASRRTAWTEAVDKTVDLDRLLTRPAAGDGTGAADLTGLLDQLPVLVPQVRQRLDDLRPQLRLSKLRPLFHPAAANVNELDALLQLPWFQVATDDEPKKEGEAPITFTRATLWQKRQEIARAFDEENRPHEDRPGEPRLAEPPPFDQEAALREEFARALARAEISILLLKLGGLSGVDRLQQELERLRLNSSEPGLRALGQGLVEAWNKAVAEQLQRLWETRDDPAAVRLMCIMPSWNQRWPWNTTDITANPAYRLQLQATVEFWTWLRDDCRRKKEQLAGADRQFYEDAEREYQQVLP